MSVQKLFFFFANAFVIRAGDKTILFDCGAVLELAKQTVARMLEEADTFFGGHGETYTREEVENLLES